MPGAHEKIPISKRLGFTILQLRPISFYFCIFSISKDWQLGSYFFRIVDVLISRLREKMNEDKKKPVYIKTLRGLGYKMEEPKEEW
jgi:hypothetical protein